MPALDIFSSSAFSMVALTDTINKMPYVPGRIGQLGLFREQGVSTTSVMIEEREGKPTPRAGTKQAQMIELLKRPEGATVEQIAQATGWQHHTIRGAISGALKKKLGLTVETTRTREVGPNQTGAKGSTTVYRITG